MKVSYRWLTEWIKKSIPLADLTEQLTNAGLELASVTPVAADFSNVIVASLIDVQPHPDADKLHVCMVDIGEGEPLQIVCGAPNVYAGMKAPLAMIGARIQGNKISKSKLRGVVSHGMLCSAKELGLAEESSGIVELPQDAPLGKSIRDYLQLDDQVIEVDLTPNRGDCASLLGIVREVVAINHCAYKMPAIRPVKPQTHETIPVKLSAPKECSRYVGRIIRGINPLAKTPLWMQEKLRRSGLNTIHPVVDVTNYVLIELGQPMHAFDFNKLSERIEVRQAKKGEKLMLLNDQEVVLTPDSLVIADRKRPLALAGVMGGLDSAVSETTSAIFLESAFFDPVSIFKTTQAYGIASDSSYRFERGVDFNLQALAMERATALLLEIVGGEPGPLIHEQYKSYLPKIKTIHLRAERIEQILGVAIADSTIETILKSLGMTLKKQSKAWKVEVPSHRFDLELEVDLVEEIARIYGYNKLPVHAYNAPMHLKAMSKTHLPTRAMRECLRDRGYHEVVTYSFVDPDVQRILKPGCEPLTLLNPMAADMSVMRTTLWAGLLQVFIYNLNRQQKRIRLFEVGKCFEGGEEKRKVAFLLYGDALPEQWGEASRLADFFDLKGDLEALLGLTGGEYYFEATAHPALHPGKSAQIFLRGEPIGVIGAIHPSVAQALDVSTKLYLCEVLLDALEETSLAIFKGISKFPSIRRDLAFIVDEGLPVAQIEQLIREKVGNLLIDLVVFDLYVGEKCEKGKKSVALGLTLQDSSRTLEEKEVFDIIERVIKTLKSDLGATLRE